MTVILYEYTPELLTYRVYFYMEIIFWIDLFLTFFIEYSSKVKYEKVRDIQKIGFRYVTGNFIFDLLAVLPFNPVLDSMTEDPREHGIHFRYIRILHLFKLLRLKKTADMFTPAYFTSFLQVIMKRLRQKEIDKIGSHCSFDGHRDYNKITELMRIVYFFKVFRLGFIVMFLAYVIGMLWYIFIQV